jgi:hypothetical protein
VSTWACQFTTALRACATGSPRSPRGWSHEAARTGRARIKRRGRSKAEASRNVLKEVREAPGADGNGEFTARSTLEEAARGWLRMFEGIVERGSRSPSTLDEYRYVWRA